MASPKLIAKVFFAVAATVSGLQQHVGTEAKLAAIELGNSVPLSEKGYQLVAAQKSDEEMKAFVHRVLAKEARYVKDVAELSGLVGFYSGTQGVQDLQSLKKELRASPWVAEGEGRTAPLTDFGYQKVAKLKSNAHMMAFARRILNLNNKVCSDEGALIGLVPYYSGQVTVQSFDLLTRELLSAPWIVAPGVESLASMPSVVPSEKTEDLEPGVRLESLASMPSIAPEKTKEDSEPGVEPLVSMPSVALSEKTQKDPEPVEPEDEEEVEESLLEDVTSISKHSHDETDQFDDDEEQEDVTKELKADNDEADKHSKGDVTKAKQIGQAKADAEHSKTAKENKSNATKESKINATKDSEPALNTGVAKQADANATKTSKSEPAVTTSVAKKADANATKKSKSEPAVNTSVAKKADANAVKKSKSKDADESGHSFFGWLTR